MRKVFFENDRYGVKIQVSLSPYLEAHMVNEKISPIYEFEIAGEKIKVFKTNAFREKLHFLHNNKKVGDPDVASIIVEELPLEVVKPTTAVFRSHNYGDMEIDLRERNKPRFSDFGIYESDDIVVRQNSWNSKLSIYKRVLGLTEASGKETPRTTLKSVTDVRVANEILKKIESEGNFHALQRYTTFLNLDRF